MRSVEGGQVPLDVDGLETELKALASHARLRLLWALRSPKKASDVRIPADRSYSGLAEGRVLSRPAIVQHLDVLEGHDLVRRLSPEDGSEYVVDQKNVFRVLQDLGRLAQIQPLVEVDVDETMDAQAREVGELPEGPKFVVVSGPTPGRVFELEGEGPWLLGRAPDVDVPLTWDPHVSEHQARILRDDDGAYLLEALTGTTNPLRLNFSEIAPSTAHPLIAGAVVTAGASRVVFQLV